jgi:hypothetical protein
LRQAWIEIARRTLCYQNARITIAAEVFAMGFPNDTALGIG